jgi:hypothetical protein
MSVLDHKKVEKTGYLGRSDFEKTALIEYDVEKTGVTRPGLSENEQYQMTVTVGVEFWANQAQYSHALPVAEKLLLSRLFGGLMGEVAEMRSAVFDGDAQRALAACDRIQKEIGL